MSPAEGGRPPRDVLGAWCGAVLAFGAAATPLVAYLAPLGFAPLVALMGLLSLPAVRMRPDDRPILAVLFAGLLWAAVSSTWSPFQPKHPQDSVALKLALQLPLYWSAICGARRASAGLQKLSARILAWGLAALGVLVVAEAVNGAALYLRLHETFYEPIRPDLAAKNVGQAAFVLGLLWPLAVAAGRRAGGAPFWLAVPMLAGVVAGLVAFKMDAPILGLVLVAAAGLAALRWPSGAPKAVGGIAAVLYLIMPALVLGVRSGLAAAGLSVPAPASYAQRLGYWRHAVDWIAEQPLRGWGLDSSRAFSPGIQLHPHNDALQVWLELGALGALLAAAFWWLALRRLSKERPDLGSAAALGSACVYLLFGVNFGVWQEWWLALGALAALVAAVLAEMKARRPST